jgi:16S rRNA (adenine1518-N6/adenine1519-N6)-dimethyltransferase
MGLIDNMHPKKSLGQNFLKNDEIADRIIKAANLAKDDTVLEVGPGTGILTERLVKEAKEVWAIEKDYDLVEKLRKRISAKNLKLIHQDALWFDLSMLSRYKVVANIPYQITSPLIRKFLENEPRPELMVLMVQKEVAERICAKPGETSRGLLTIIVEYFAQAEILFEVSRREFYPVPGVDSAVIRIVTKIPETRNRLDEAIFFKTVKAGFSAKRRQIHNSLAATWRTPKGKVIEILEKLEIDPMLRAEDLTLKQWLDLSRVARDNIY